MQTPDHTIFFEKLLGPRRDDHKTPYLGNPDTRKLACVCTHLRNLVPLVESDHANNMKKHSESVFGRVFNAICDICIQAGYSPTNMPGFYKNVNIFLSGKYAEEIELDTLPFKCKQEIELDTLHGKRKEEVELDTYKRMQSITVDGMPDLTVGRSRACHFICLADPNASRKHGTIHKKDGKLVYTNTSEQNDSFLKVGGVPGFEVCKKKKGTDIHTCILQIGDQVIITSMHFSTLRVNISEADMERLINMMHLTKCQQDPRSAPFTTEEALCEIELARAVQYSKSYSDFRSYYESNIMLLGQARQQQELKVCNLVSNEIRKKVDIMKANVTILQDKLDEVKKTQYDTKQEHKRAKRAISNTGGDLEMLPPSPQELLPQCLKLRISEQQAEIEAYRQELAQQVVLLAEQEQLHAENLLLIQEHEKAHNEHLRIIQEHEEANHQQALLMKDHEEAHHQQTLLMKEQENTLADIALQKECCICKNPRETYWVFNPCQHVCCCQECATSILNYQPHECPLCRMQVENVGRVFM